MSSLVKRLCDRGLIRPPKWVHSATQYEVNVGSSMYGVSTDLSDFDINGFCIPPKDMVFPHLRGEIPGFGRQVKRFGQYQQHHIKDPSNPKEYDISIYSIVKFFQLCMENNPNMLDSLFAPDTNVLSITKIGTMVREARKSFLHKGAWHRYKGYAYSQLHKARAKTAEPGSKRAKIREQYGWDVKFGYHTVRLIGEVEQILLAGDIDLQRNREHLKAIRRGEVSQEDVERWFSDKEKSLEKLYETSKLRHSPDEPTLKKLLLACLEEHYTSIEGCVEEADAAVTALREMQEVLNRNARLF